MSAVEIDLIGRSARHMDAALARIERARLNPPDDAEDDAEECTLDDFLADPVETQRTAIRDYLRKWSCDEGLYGEALCEHRLAGDIRAAHQASDMESFGRLCDIAVREYIGKQVVDMWNLEPRK